MKHLILSGLLLLLNTLLDAQSKEKEWTFYNEKDQSECSFRQNQTIKVKWKSTHWKVNSKGKLLDISKDSIKIWETGASAAPCTSLSIAKQDIIRMKGKWKISFWDGFFTVLFIIIGVIISIFVFLAFSLDSTSSLEKNKEEIQKWFFAGIFSYWLD